MRNVWAGAMVITMALCIYAAVINFAGVTPDLAAPAYALAVLLGLFWAGKLFVAKAVSWRFSVIHIPVAGFFLYATARYFFSPLEYEARLDLINIGFCTLVYFVAAANFYRSRDREWFIWALLLLALFEAIYGIYQFATRSPTVFGLPRPEGYINRGGGTYICPNHLAGFLEMVLGLLLGRLVLQRTSSLSVQQLALRKIGLGYGAVIVLGGLIASLSRGGWIAASVGMSSLVLWGGSQLRAIWVRVLVILFGLGLLVGLLFGIPKVRDHIQMTFSSSKEKAMGVRDLSLGGRTGMWGATWDMIRDHPLFGVGGGSWPWVHLKYRRPEVQFRPEYAHNDILHFTADYGLIGAVLLAGIFGCLFRQVVLLNRERSSTDHRSFAVGVALAATAILVHSWFDFNLHMPANALLLATLLGFTAAEEDGRSKRTEMGRVPRYALGALVVAFCAFAIWFVTPVCLSARYTVLGNRAKAFLQWDDALVYYEKAIRLDPKAWEPYQKSGDVYLNKVEWRDRSKVEERKQLSNAAITNYTRALALNPLNSEIMARLGRAYELQGDVDSARKTLEHMIEIDPNGSANHLVLGRFYRHIGEETKAEEAYRRSHDLLWSSESVLNLEDISRPQK